MSNVIVHLDPLALQHRKLARQDRERHTIHRPGKAAIYSQINKLQVKEMEILAHERIAEREAAEARRKAREEALRARVTGRMHLGESEPAVRAPPSRNGRTTGSAKGTAAATSSAAVSPGRAATPTKKGLAQVSPRKDKRSVYAIADQSAEIAAMEVAPNVPHARGDLPAYLLRRMDQQLQREERQLEEDYLAYARGMMPEGQEPMNAKLAERTKMFLRKQIADLEGAINSFSFSRRESVTGKMKLGQLEEELYIANETLRRFDFPVIFVERHNPIPVDAQPERLGSRQRPRTARQ